MKSTCSKRWFAGLAFALLLAPPVSAQDALDSVVIVLDASGSMSRPLPGSGTDKMTAAKAALKQVLETVPDSTRVGLLVFSAAGVEDHWLYPLGPRENAKLMQAIDRPQPGGGTPLGKYLKIGADRLLEERARQFGYGTFRLLVVTDGEADDSRPVDRYTPEIIARGITVDVIGVAMKQTHTLATRVHSYRSANDPASLKLALASVFGEIGGKSDDVAAANAFAELAPIPSELAGKMIQALASSGNQPIGEPPRPVESVSTAGAAQAAAAQAEAARQSAKTVPRWAPIMPMASLLCIGMIGLLFLFLIVRAIRSRR